MLLVENMFSLDLWQFSKPYYLLNSLIDKPAPSLIDRCIIYERPQIAKHEFAAPRNWLYICLLCLKSFYAQPQKPIWVNYIFLRFHGKGKKDNNNN